MWGRKNGHNLYQCEYCKVVFFFPYPVQEELDRYSTEFDLLLVDIWRVKTLLAGILNPVRRARFGETVVELLRAMRKFESANQAAELWNKITD